MPVLPQRYRSSLAPSPATRNLAHATHRHQQGLQNRQPLFEPASTGQLMRGQHAVPLKRRTCVTSATTCTRQQAHVGGGRLGGWRCRRRRPRCARICFGFVIYVQPHVCHLYSCERTTSIHTHVNSQPATQPAQRSTPTTGRLPPAADAAEDVRRRRARWFLALRLLSR